MEPRATPTIADGHVYTVGATGVVSCVTLDTGELVWQRSLYKDPGGGRPE
jgi:outer membrane protein assembly factor BamB